MDEATPMKPKKAAEEGHVSKLRSLMVAGLWGGAYMEEREREKTPGVSWRKNKNRGSAEHKTDTAGTRTPSCLCGATKHRTGLCQVSRTQTQARVVVVDASSCATTTETGFGRVGSFAAGFSCAFSVYSFRR